ncbi:YrhB domain-containing protein [Symbioplanes lichenis]|uniref:YrhB domain-containing protein n=1 Tax=Symbioplanes lichenis TaxID=1629072 RepID=UPI002738E927|nr:YrhB domain-containing protein [Actinoplanes lichenis]
MNADDARARATAVLRELEDPNRPLALVNASQPGEYEWCWVFPYNTAKAIETGSFLDSLATGPLVVPKNGAQPFVAPPSPPLERWLNEYAQREGLPQVPVPPAPDPFA